MAAQDQQRAQAHPVHAAFARAAQAAHFLAPPEDLFDPLAHFLAGLITERARGAPVQALDMPVFVGAICGTMACSRQKSTSSAL